MALLSFLSTAHYRWLALLWTAGIVVACSLPAASLSPIEPALSADKAAHFGLFAGFGALWMRALCPPASVTPARLRRQGGRLLIWGTLFAVGTEVYQHLLPLQRLGDPYDALADGGGLLLSVIAYALLVRSRTTDDRSTRAN
jgi:hypothetical protein